MSMSCSCTPCEKLDYCGIQWAPRRKVAEYGEQPDNEYLLKGYTLILATALFLLHKFVDINKRAGRKAEFILKR